MFCNKCGTEITDQSKFCPQCGTLTLSAETENTSTNREMQSASTQKNIKKPKWCGKGCFVAIAIFIVLIVIGGINDSCERRKLEQAISNAQFNSPIDIQSFIREHDLNIRELDTEWEAERTNQQDCVDKLYTEYQRLQEKEQREQATSEAQELLGNPPEKNYASYMSQLQILKQHIDDTELIEEIDAELERLEPLRIVEEVRQLLDNPPSENHSMYIENLLLYSDLVESQELRNEIESKISEHKELADRESELLREMAQQELAEIQELAEQQKREAEYEGKGEEARELTSMLFMVLNPQATINWATYEYGVVQGGDKVLVRFEYSVVNAFGARVQRRYSVWWDYELIEILDEQDEFLYFRE